MKEHDVMSIRGKYLHFKGLWNA